MMVGRGAKRKGTRYFGPYGHAWAIRETVDLLLRVFPMRSCSNGVFKRSSQIGRPCLLGYIDKCAAPCVGNVTAEEHRRDRRRLLRLHGRQHQRLRAPHRAGDVRRVRGDGLREGRPAARRPRRACARRWRSRRWCSATAPTPTSSRSPRTRSRSRCRSSTCAAGASAASAAGSPTAPTTATPPGWSRSSCSSCTAAQRPRTTPRRSRARCWCPRCRPTPASSRTCSATSGGAGWRSGCRSAATSWRCRRPSRPTPARRSCCTRPSGPATSPPATAPWRRSSRRSALDEVPLRIECYDISNLQGTEVVASMVVFEDGLPRKGEYRRFVIRGEDGADGRPGRPERRRPHAPGHHPAVPAAARRAGQRSRGR